MELDAQLQMSRLAAVALNTLCADLKLGNLAIRFHGDDADAWAISGPHYIKALDHSRVVAELDFNLPDITILIPDIAMIIRPERVSDFNPTDYGLEYNTAVNWRGEKEADLIADWVVTPSVQIPKGPRAYIPKSETTRKYKGIRSW